MADSQLSFDELLSGWMAAAAVNFGYAPPQPDDYEEVYARLPVGVRELICQGHTDGLIRTVSGYRFTLSGLPAGKGPYAWLGRSEERQVPTVHWEYLMQAAEYARVFSVLAPKGYLIGVEDRLMDITVSNDSGQLLWYIEVKESATGLVRFAEEIRRFGRDGFDPDTPDRGRDGLRKAKYLVRYKPNYFSLSATGMRLDFAVDYRGAATFELTPDMVPLA